MLARKPYYSSIIVIMLPLLVYCVNLSLGFFFGRSFTSSNPTSNIFHFIGGISISLSAAGFLWHLTNRKIIAIQDVTVFRSLVFGCLCFAIIIWEIHEYYLLYPIYPELVSYSDTITDMIYGLLGGVSVIFLVGSLLPNNSS